MPGDEQLDEQPGRLRPGGLAGGDAFRGEPAHQVVAGLSRLGGEQFLEVAEQRRPARPHDLGAGGDGGEGGRRWHTTFESTSLPGVRAAVRAGLGAAALLPATVEPGTAARGLPQLPEVELGLVRRPGTEGDPLVDAVEDVLKRLV
ncbi:LysR substrate-binding domain-containing protein [Streptomyces sp. NPDC020192]|uniref:LysR substrate-binding domain-containing protein n=1 Tax=Streptomyces sp. NPDC020192 TaxID=3365066 RepID=UPI0037A92D69